jgi:Cu2+-exporting ATPase
MSKVERGLAAVPGVASARTNLTARTVEVIHDPQLATPDLVAALAAAGFEAQPREIQAEAASAVKPLLAPLAVAGFACMNVMLLSVSVWSGADGTTRDRSTGFRR